MKKYVKKDGKYIIDGVSYKLLSGSRAQVWHGTAYKTTGGLIKDDLVKNKHGEIVSKKKHMQETKDSNLIKHGYGYKTDGTFGYEKIKSTIKKNTKMRQTPTKKNAKTSQTPIATSDEIAQQGGYHVAGHETSSLAKQSSQFGGSHRSKTIGRSSHAYSMGGDPDAIDGLDGLYGDEPKEEEPKEEEPEINVDDMYGGKRRKSRNRSHKRRVGVSSSKSSKSRSGSRSKSRSGSRSKSRSKSRSGSRSGSRSRMLAGGGVASSANLFL